MADGGYAEVLWFDAEGRAVRTLGTRGDGPGEYRRIAAIREGPGGEVDDDDAGHARMTVLDQEIVVPSDVRHLGTTMLPKGARVLHVRGSRVAVLHRDRVDQEFVTVYGVR